MTNDEFRIKNGELAGEMSKAETAIFDSIRSMFEGINLPQPSQAFSTKLDELFETFEHDEEPLDQHLTIILATQYMLGHCQNTVGHVQGYVDKILQAARIGDNDTVRTLLELGSDVEAHWAEMDQELLNLDFRKDLDKIVDSVRPLPKNISRETALRICDYELDVAKYEPKKGPNIGSR